MYTRYIKIFLVALFGLSLISCSSDKDNNDDYCNSDNLYIHEIMQRIRLLDKDRNWIKGIDTAKVELTAMDSDWKNPIFDENGNMLKQIPNRIEAKKYIDNSKVRWIELYLAHKDNVLNKSVLDSYSYFTLKVGDKSFNISAKYFSDRCLRYIPRYFSLSEKDYPVGVTWVNITVED